jgi:hypothetical protein
MKENLVIDLFIPNHSNNFTKKNLSIGTLHTINKD